MTTGDLIQVSKRELVIPVDDGAGRGPGDSIVVTNVAAGDIAFKMKTTNPARYIVRPNVAVVARGASVEIRVFLAESAAAPAPGPSKDRFQLRVALAPGLADAPGADAGGFWRAHEADAPQLRLRFVVKFVPHVPPPAAAAPARAPEPTPDAAALLAPGAGPAAAGALARLEGTLQERDAELARVRTALRETIAEKDRTLADAPAPPPAAHKALQDPFGGLSIVAVGLVFAVVALMYKLFL